MLNKKNNGVPDEKLDQLGKALVQSLRHHDPAAENAVDSQQGYARLRARIAREKAGASASPSIWQTIVDLAGQSLSTFGLVTAAAMLLVWVIPAQPGMEPQRATRIGPKPEEQLVRLTPMRECTISTKQDCSVSPAEVLAIMVKQKK